MRRSLVLAVALGACGFQIAPGGLEIDAPFFDDGGGLGETWSFDTAAELAVPGHERAGMTIEPRGSLTPEGYVYGALLGRGLFGMKLWSHGDSAWSKLAAVTATGTGLWSGNELTTANDLALFGIRPNAVMRTVWFEGELMLRAGTEQLKLQGDEIAFLELATPGTQAFTPLLENALAPTAVVTVPTTGWYPVRIGWADGNGNGNIRLEIQGSTGFEPISAHRLRAPVAGVQGMLRSVFYRQVHGGGIPNGAPPPQHIQPAPFLQRAPFAPPLQGSVLDTDTTTGPAIDWSARWAGQLYAAVPGQYSLRIDSDDGVRVFLGTAPVTEVAWARNVSNPTPVTNVTAALREGWNDLIVDYNQVSSTAFLGVHLLASPDPALAVNSPLPLGQLRPVEPQGQRLLVRTVVPSSPELVEEDTRVFAEVPVLVAAQPGQIVTRVDVTYVYTSDEPIQLLFRVIRPGGTEVIVRSHPVITGGGVLTLHVFSIDPGLVGGPVDGVWTIGIADDVNGGSNSNSSLDEVHLTLHTRGGPEQIERAATWRTPIKDLGTRLVKIDALSWDHRAPAGTAVEVRLRSCDQADCADEPSWGDALANGMPVMLPQRRYLQAQVSMASDGTNEPELRALKMVYRRTAM